MLLHKRSLYTFISKQNIDKLKESLTLTVHSYRRGREEVLVGGVRDFPSRRRPYQPDLSIMSGSFIYKKRISSVLAAVSIWPVLVTVPISFLTCHIVETTAIDLSLDVPTMCEAFSADQKDVGECFYSCQQC